MAGGGMKEGRTIDRATGEVKEGTVRPFADVLRASHLPIR